MNHQIMRCDWFRISSVPAKITSNFPSLSLSLDGYDKLRRKTDVPF